MRVIRSIKVWIEGFDKVNQAVDDLQVLYEFFEAEEATEEEIDAQYEKTLGYIEDLETRNMLRKKKTNWELFCG